MNLSAPTVLVTVVFAAQILVLSVLVPYQFRKANSRLMERYPPRAYPRLYPVVPGEIERFNAILAVVRLVIVVAGTATFAVHLAEGRTPADLARTMVWVALAQTVPGLVWARWQLRMARKARAMPAPPVRSAELHPSRLTDFVPLPLIAAGIAGSVLSLVSAIALYRTDPGRQWVTVVSVLAFSGWVLPRMLIALRAPGSIPRPDPYMTDGDVFRTRRQRLRGLFMGSAVVGASCTLILLFKSGRLPVDIVAICIGCSILCQLIYLGAARVVLRTLAMRDASVYRAEAT
jgi:hypothetical protein